MNTELSNLESSRGKISFIKSLPYALQHLLAIFISNIAPILLLLTNQQINTDLTLTMQLVQNSLLISGISSLIQFFPIWKFGGNLPLFMGMNFTYYSLGTMISIKYGYDTFITSCMIGSLVMVGSSFFVKKIVNIIPKIISSLLVVVLGFSLTYSQIEGLDILSKEFYHYKNLIVIGIIVIVYFFSNFLFKKRLKNYAILLSLLSGYIMSIIFGNVDFSAFSKNSIVSYPKIYLFSHLNFNIDAILSVSILCLISISEIFGTVFCLDMDKNNESIEGCVKGTGIASLVSSIFGCIPVTPFMGNVSIINNTKVTNRNVLSITALCLILASFFPFFGVFAMSIPKVVVYTTMAILFISICISGIKMLINTMTTSIDFIIIILTICISIALFIFGSYIKTLPKVLSLICCNFITTTFIGGMILNYMIKGMRKNEK